MLKKYHQFLLRIFKYYDIGKYSEERLTKLTLEFYACSKMTKSCVNQFDAQEICLLVTRAYIGVVAAHSTMVMSYTVRFNNWNSSLSTPGRQEKA